MNDVIDLINTNRDRYVDELKSYLAIPSISALPEHADDVRACAEWTAAEMQRVGLENVRIIDTPGNPVVYADWLHADGAPTIHHADDAFKPPRARHIPDDLVIASATERLGMMRLGVGFRPRCGPRIPATRGVA